MSQLELTASYAIKESQDRYSPFNPLDVTVGGRRAVAGAIDWLLIVSLFALLAHRYGLIYNRTTVAFPVPSFLSFFPHRFAFGFWYLHLLPLIVLVAIGLAYYTVFECALGWTIGKRTMGIRVVDFFGGKPTLLQSAIRNVFRILDAYPYIVPNLVGVAIAMSNNRRQRGGDKAAGTLVVDDRAHRYARELRRHAERVSADLFDQDIHAADSDEMVAAAVAPENNEELDEAEDESVAATGHLNAATEEASNPAIGIAPDPHALTPSESEHEDLDPVQNASPSSWTSPFSRAASPSPLVSPEESHASTNGDPSGWTSPLSRAASLSPSEPTEEDQLKPYSYPPGWGSIVEQAGQEVGCAIPVSDFGPHLSDPAFGVEGQANPGADF